MIKYLNRIGLPREQAVNIYEAQINWGDRLRDLKLTPLARLFYILALRTGGNQDRHIQQMIGVCYTMERNRRKADRWFGRAIEGAEGVDKANILRDWSKRYLLDNDYQAALNHLHEALDLLKGYQYESPRATTLGFIGQVLAKQGRHGEATTYYGRANEILGHQVDIRPCLFNKLHAAKNLLDDGCYSSGREVAGDALIMARSLRLWPHWAWARWLIIRAAAQDMDARSL